MAPTEKIERTLFALWYVYDFVCMRRSFIFFCLLIPIHGLTTIVAEYHWIYRFVVQDASIRLMGESCGYIEQVDDRAVLGFFSGKDFGSTLKTRRQGKRRSRRLKRHNSFKGLRRRQPSHKDESSYDSSVFKKEYSRKRSLLDGREDEERPDTTSVNNKTSTSYNADEQYTKDQQNTGAMIM